MRPTPSHLRLERVLVEYEGPQLIALISPGGDLFIAVASDDDRDAVRWTVAPLSLTDLAALRAESIPLRGILTRGKALVVDATRDRKSPFQSVNEWEIDGAALPDFALPEPDTAMPSEWFDDIGESAAP